MLVVHVEVVDNEAVGEAQTYLSNCHLRTEFLRQDNAYPCSNLSLNGRNVEQENAPKIETYDRPDGAVDDMFGFFQLSLCKCGANLHHFCGKPLEKEGISFRYSCFFVILHRKESLS